MKIGVPTNDGTMISEHFGRSDAFLIFEIEDGKIKNRELKANGMSHSHAVAECEHHSDDSQPRSHAGILSALEGCDRVICAGMGQRAAEALRMRGIQIVIAAPGPAEGTVSAYLAGKLPVGGETFCQCHH